MEFGRLITAMVTPFDANERIHWPEVERLIHDLIEVQRNDSLVICGTTGESPTLTDEEKVEPVQVRGGKSCREGSDHCRYRQQQHGPLDSYDEAGRGSRRRRRSIGRALL